MRVSAGEFAALLRSHSFLAVEQPPELWGLRAASLDAFVRGLGELIVAGLVRNDNELSTLTLNVANVVVDETSEAGELGLSVGDYVAVTIRGGGSWPDSVWRAGDEPSSAELSSAELLSAELGAALAVAHAVFGYSRDLGADGGSVTALFSRDDADA